MINIGLNAEELKLFNRSLYTGYNLKVTVQVLDLSHNYITDISHLIQDGQVNIDADASPTRSATLTVLDADYSLGFDSTSPGDGSLFMDRMIRIVYSVYSSLLPKWVDVPIFCGPITNQKRDEALLSLECQGKESRFLPPSIYWNSATFKKNTDVDSLIKKVMAEKGEAKFDIPNLTVKTTKDLSLTPESNVWEFVNKIKPAGYQLFYDGRGVLRLLEKATSPVYTFHEEALLTVPEAAYDGASVLNAVYIKGGTPKGKGKKQIVAKLAAPAGVIGSPVGLGANGKPNQRALIIEDDKLDTQKKANAEAKKQLDRLLLDNVTVSFETFVIPHLEPGDVYTLKTRNYSLNQTVKQMSIPLTAASGGTMGSAKRVARSTRFIRSRKA